MRQLSVLASLAAIAALVACGDNNNNGPADGPPVQFDSPPGTPDGPDVDAPPGTPDANVDAMPMPPDAMVDAMPAAPSRIWVTGDWMADNIDKSGFFLDDAVLPVVPGVFVPPGTDELGFGTAFTNVVDLSADGGQMVYVSIEGGLSTLNFANGDGTSPIVVHQAPAGVEVGYVAISPDGTKVAYTADAVLDGMLDLYVAPTTAAATVVKISPDRATNNAVLDAFRGVTWSPDSRYVAFSGRFTEDQYDEVLVADTMAAPPSLATLLPRADIMVPMAVTGAKGIRGAALFDANGEVWFRARIANSNTPPFELFHAPAGGGARVTVATPTRADTTASEVGAFAINPAGTHIAYSADAPVATAYEVYYAAVATPTTTIQLTNNTVIAGGNPEFTTPMWYSPDGMRLAFVGDLAAVNVNEPYVVTVAGGGQTRLVALTGNMDALQAQWNNTGSALYVVGDMLVDNDTSLFRVSPTTADQTPPLAVGVPTGGDLTDVDVR